MPSSSFYDAGTLRQIATNLFHGWGYNFYRAENQLRADDQLVRARRDGCSDWRRRASATPKARTGGNFSRRLRGRSPFRMPPRSRPRSNSSGLAVN